MSNRQSFLPRRQKDDDPHNPRATAVNTGTDCARCGNCCRWAGIVRIQPTEADAIARRLNLTPYNFTAQYTRLLPDRSGLSLTETKNGACVFLSGNDCQIHNVKPRQCRDFPHAWTCEPAKNRCRAYALTAFV
ncbi:MAG: YkgJ family cysteine cluster protein [Verrucomicrobia bacterium]|nr:YkgJ family cysteine cluster protein [Verrucomicrobiota bacterium]MCG2678679.1 YkgJ family cysteine cluster protein [Kiritimatiellia bacterium]MBU4248500.1 YkgJ family cysteine cluster protein [Verrucomicrobiota bacterium]MBU4291312.1 YkgJ family cysteine cluster protein [Verrucomicrobiota bacterium]MBU4429180.1 YkgJ family cysteine cluster protein [Verrucomicrobiota bacterium]